MKWLSIIIGVLAIILTIKPFIRSANWFIRLGDFPRLQVLFVLIISLIFEIFTFDFRNVFDYLFCLVLIICTIYQIRCVLPFTPIFPKEVQNAREPDFDDTNISILIFNVLMENERYSEVLEFIKSVNADVILLAEPNKIWAENLAELKQIYPFEVSHILENHYGMMFFSRLEIHDTEVQFIIQEDIPSIHTQIKLRSGDDIAFHGVHPRPPVPEEKGRSTERDGELLLVGKAVRESNLPCIVAGDLNDAAWSYSTRLFKRISGPLDPRVGRGFYNTFHAQHKIFRLPLDHVFHSHHFRLINLQRIKNSCGSDHFPVLINLSYEKDATAEQRKPIADITETDEAHEIVSVALKENRFKRLSFRRLKEKIMKLKQKISRKR
ncbi:MAG TPA: endonuclease/exonuclease/phosphatase family protein [Pyrinomonadaceae bacterium]|nr:endonuclease/exonuclease/phosphatase family protein [Pyrinomonadaceae bacterium]